MSFCAVVMRDPTVLLCAFFGRHRRRQNVAEKERHEPNNRCDIAQMTNEKCSKIRSALQSKAGETSTFSGVILGGSPISEECA